MLETPYPYQLTGAEWLAPKTQALLADAMGLGKSCQAVRASDIVGAKNILVLCPAVARVNWQREFQKFSPMDRPCKVIFTGKDSIPDGGVVVCSYDLANAHLEELSRVPWDLLILDEAHYLKERTAKRTRAVYGHGKRLAGLHERAARVWRLTGTPAPNNASELWTHLKSAKLIEDSYWDFTFRYCSGFDSNYGYRITGHKNVEELKTLLKPFMLRRLKEDVMSDLPPIRFQEVTVERGPVQLDPDFFEVIRPIGEAKFLENMRVGEQSLADALAKVNGDSDAGRLSVLEAAAADKSQVTLRRFIAMTKLPSILDIIETELKVGLVSKIVLFGIHKTVIETTRERLKAFGAVTLYGGTPPAKRQRNIDHFMTRSSCRVLVGNIQAAGTAINLNAATEGAFLEQSWVPSDNAQAAARLYRAADPNQKPVRIRIFSLHDSVDQIVQETLVRKIRELAKIL